MTVIVKTQVSCIECGHRFMVAGVAKSGDIATCKICDREVEVIAIVVHRKLVDLREAVKL